MMRNHLAVLVNSVIPLPLEQLFVPLGFRPPAKAIQYRYRADWLANPPRDTELLDLKNDIRPIPVSPGREIVSIGKWLK